jgi:NADP-dependent 3-hydroxy acid dehydrogenase YdfG
MDALVETRGTSCEADGVARVVMFAVSQPPHLDVNEILVRGTAQE